MDIFDLEDNFTMNVSEFSLEQVIRYEISQYNAMKIEDPKNLEVLDWWKKHQRNFPHLFNIFQRYMHIPATSVPSERMFSLAGNTITEKEHVYYQEM